MTRSDARALLDNMVKKVSDRVTSLAELGDSPTVCNAIDELEDMEGEEANDYAEEAAAEILEDEGFPFFD